MMNPGMKMLMLEKATERRPNRSEYGGDSERRMIGYDRDYVTENRRYAERDDMKNRMRYDSMDYEPAESRRRRDDRGRFMEGEGWEGNRGYLRSNYEPEARRRRDSGGRYMVGRMDDDDDEMEMRAQTWYPPYGNVSYIHPVNMYHPGNSYGDIYAHGSIYAPGAMNKSMGMQAGMAAPVDEHTARMWVQKMDGGEHFKMEQSEQLRNAICPDCDRFEYFVAINAMYSDYCETAKKMGMDKPEFYAHLAKDFLHDKDAGPHKLRKYMETIPR